MRLENSFEVPVTVEDAWQVLLDVPRIAPCMPGATLTGTDGDEFTGTVKVKLGPITLTYQGKGRFVERDEAAHRVVIEASGKDSRSAGTATATVTAGLTGQGDNTKVDVVTDLTVTGKPAQFGRGMIADVSGKLIGQFADCLAGELRSGATPAAAVSEPVPESASPPADAASESESESPSHHGSAVERELTAAATAGTGAARTSPTGADPSGGTGSGRPAAPAVPAPAATATRPRPVAAEAEPIDLLKLTSGSPAARRLAAIGAGALLLAALAWLLARRRRVSRRS
jgi:carbon monoxide dehydrogenase subunit G